MKAFSYIRFSSTAQEKGDSLRRQTEDRDNYLAKKKLNLHPLRMEDLGISARGGNNLKNGAFRLFLEAIDKKIALPGDVLILENLDRMSRADISTALPVFLQILNAGIKIVTLNPEREFTQESVNNEMQIFEVILGFKVAHQQNELKADRVSKAWAKKKLNAGEKVLTSKGPEWLTLQGGKWELVEEEVSYIRKMFQLANDGMGIGSIVKELNQQDRRQKWAVSTVKKYLRDRRMLGEFQGYKGSHPNRKPDGEPVPGYFPAIITENLFDRVQNALDERRNHQKGRTGDNVANLFTGLFRYAADGSSMNLVNKGTKSSGKCLVSYAATRGIGAEYKSFNYDKFETQFFWLIRNQMKDMFREDKVTVSAMATLTAKLARVEKRIADIEKQLMGDDDVAVLVNVVRKLSAERETLKEEIEVEKRKDAISNRETANQLKTLVEWIEPLTQPATRLKLRGLIASLVESIWVYYWDEREADPNSIYRDRAVRKALFQIRFKSGDIVNLVLNNKNTTEELWQDREIDLPNYQNKQTDNHPWELPDENQSQTA